MELLIRLNKANATKVFRLVVEALEVAFFLCNILLDHYGVNKILDLLNQILPTAYVYNTGYWPLYCTENRQSICVCQRFGIDCRHHRDGFHFLNMTNVAENQPSCSESRGNKFFPVKAYIRLSPLIVGGSKGYRIKIDVTAEHLSVQEGEFVPISTKISTLKIDANYYFLAQRRLMQPAGLTFVPHPFSVDASSSYFECSRKYKRFLNTSTNAIDIPPSYTVQSSKMPNYTLVYNPIRVISEARKQVRHLGLSEEREGYQSHVYGTSPDITSLRSKPYLHYSSPIRTAWMSGEATLTLVVVATEDGENLPTSTDVQNTLEGNETNEENRSQ